LIKEFPSIYALTRTLIALGRHLLQSSSRHRHGSATMQRNIHSNQLSLRNIQGQWLFGEVASALSDDPV
jgi:uncharacterized membrane protein YjjP (DUF1212 family)